MHQTEIATAATFIDGDLPFRQLADHLPALCFMADAKGRGIWCNRRWYDYTGVAPGADLSAAWLTLPDPAVAAEVVGRWFDCVRSRQAGEMVVPIRGTDGRYRPFLTRAEPVLHHDGTLRCWLGTMTEIGEQQQAEQNQRFLVGLGDALRDKTDPIEILAITGEMLGTHLDVLRVGYGEVEADENTVHAGGRGWQRREQRPRLPVDVGLDSFGRGIAEQLRRGEISVVADTMSDPAVGDCIGTHLESAIHASITVPLVKAGRLAAFLYAHSDEARLWSEADLQLVREVAERTWSTLERANADAARRQSDAKLRDSEAWLRAIVETTPECVKLVAQDGSLNHMNAAGMRMMECDTEVIGKSIIDMIAPEYRDEWMKRHERVCAGASLTWEFDIIGLKGTRRRMETHAVPLCGSDGKMLQLSVTRDITERKATEHALAQTEERFRRVIETAHEGIWMVDERGQTLFVNERMASLLGTTQDDMRGRSVPEYCFSEDLDEARLRIGNNLAGKREQFEFRFRRSDGSAVPVLTASTPLQDRAGKVIGAVGMFSDLSERKLAEEQLRDSQALLAAFRNNAPIGMYMKDADGRYQMVNPEMEKVFGVPAEQIVGRTAYDLFEPAEARMIAEYDRQVLESGQASSVEEFLPGHDNYAWSLVVRFPIALKDGQPTRIGGFDIDLSDLKLAEAELQQSRDALYQSEKLTALGSLLAGVSHELNNPLSIVLTLSELLEQKAAGTPLAERASKIHAAAMRCGKIVQTFLAMARQKAPVRSRVDVNDLVSDALGLADYGLRTAGVDIVRELDPVLPSIDGDPDQIAQVLVNLVVNAQQSLLDSHGERRLTVRTSTDDRRRVVRIEVEDNGPGVPSDIRRRIFDPFFTSKPQGQGTGIGLSFSLGVVEAHGGRLRLDDSLSSGARFVIEFPFAEGELHASAASQDQQIEIGGRGRALVVDDEPDLGDALAELLIDEGYAVDVVRSGEDATGMIGAHAYDLILSDLRMPGTDGPALFDWIEDEHPHLLARLAFLTGDTLSAAAASFIDRARRPTLEKPFDRAALRRMLTDLPGSSDG